MTKRSKRPPLHPEVEAYWKRMKRKPADAASVISMREDAAPTIGKSTMHEINKTKKISHKEKEKVGQLYEEMRSDFPSDNRCYEAIASELGIKSRRVRYIIEGLRRKK